MTRRTKNSTSKVLTKELKEENNLLAELVVAEKLSLTLSELRERMTPEELWLWHAFFNLQNQQQEEAMKKAKRGRR